MKIGKSHVFVLAMALIIIYAAFVSGSGGYCSAREFFSGRHDEEDDACIAKLIKRADDDAHHESDEKQVQKSRRLKPCDRFKIRREKGRDARDQKANARDKITAH